MFNRFVFSMGLVGCCGWLVGCGDQKDTTPAAPSPLAGHTYALTTTDRDWSEPRGHAGDIETVMPVFLFQVSEGPGKSLRALMATAPKVLDADGRPTGEITQDLCGPTYDIPLAGSALGPTTAMVHLTNDAGTSDSSDDVQVTAEVRDLAFTSIFPPNGDAWADPDDLPGTLGATMDFRALAPLFTTIYSNGVPPTDEDVCELLGDEHGCEPCADGHVSCMSAHAALIGAADRPDLSVVPVDLDARDVSCAN